MFSNTKKIVAASLSVSVVGLMMGWVWLKPSPAKSPLVVPVPQAVEMSREGRLPNGIPYRLTLRQITSRPNDTDAHPLIGVPPGAKAVPRLAGFECVINHVIMTIPAEAFTDLAAVDLRDGPHFDWDGRHFSVILRGGRDADAYEATLRIDPPRLVERRIQFSGKAAILAMYQPPVPALSGMIVPSNVAAAAEPFAAYP